MYISHLRSASAVNYCNTCKDVFTYVIVAMDYGRIRVLLTVPYIVQLQSSAKSGLGGDFDFGADQQDVATYFYDVVGMHCWPPTHSSWDSDEITVS